MPESQDPTSASRSGKNGRRVAAVVLLAVAAAVGGGVALTRKAAPGAIVAEVGAKVGLATPFYPATGTYNVFNKQSGQYLNLAGGVVKKEGNVQIWNNPLSPDSQWELTQITTQIGIVGTGGAVVPTTKTAPGNYMFSPLGSVSTWALNLAAGGQDGNTNVQIYNNPGSLDSQWQFFTRIETNEPVLVIKSMKGDYFLTTACTTLGCNVEITTDINAPGAVWELRTPGAANPQIDLADPAPGVYNIESVQEVPSDYGTYKLWLNSAGGGKTNETNVQLYTNSTSLHSQWNIQPLLGGSNFFTLESVSAPSLYLNLAGGGSNDMTNVQLYGNPGNRDSQWNFYKVQGTNPEQYLIKAANGMYLNAERNTRESNVIVSTWTGVPSRWILIPVVTTPAVTPVVTTPVAAPVIPTVTR